MSMPSAKRKPAPTPPSKSRYLDEVHGNAAPFTPAPLDFLNPMRTVKGGIEAVASIKDNDEDGTGKSDEA